MSRKIPKNSMPADFFCRQTLELSFRLLHSKSPLLAHAIKIAIDKCKPVDYADMHSHFTGEMLLNNDLLEHLSPHIIGRIVAHLTHLGSEALDKRDLPNSHIAIMRTLIDDWVKLTEWILENAATAASDITPYH